MMTESVSGIYRKKPNPCCDSEDEFSNMCIPKHLNEKPCTNRAVP